MRKALKYSWFFHRGDIETAEHSVVDDRWQAVRVPHDWAIEGPFDKDNDRQFKEIVADGIMDKMDLIGRTGALPVSGTSWYLRDIRLDASHIDKRIFLDFDGVMSNATVYLNGKELGNRPFGYASYSYEITDYVTHDAPNKMAVKVAPEPATSRWYPGAGIYRNVYLRVEERTHVSKNGTYITTELSDDSAVITIETIIKGVVDGYQLKTQIFDGEQMIAETVTPVKDTVVRQHLMVDNPKLWSVKSPNLYQARSILVKDGVEREAYLTTFGVRTIAFDAKEGFALNGEYMKLNGVCMHHDLGALGAAFNRRAAQRQLEILKEMGCSSIRTSHNPPAVELLDLCDTMGFLVIDECFDEWHYGKVDNGYHKHFDKWAEADLVDMLHRDRNHPSIIMWSIGNEILDQKYADGKHTARFLTEICHRVDPTRPVTAGFNHSEEAIANGLPDEVDIVGLNYKPHLYERYAKEHPDWIIYSSETESCVSSRGIYHFPVKEDIPSTLMEDLTVSSYDMSAPGWAYPPDREFDVQDRMKNILGEFVWTGFDYLGEPTPYGTLWPSRSAYFGIVDLCGIPKDRYYAYKARWSGEDVLHVFPHWDFKERIGQVTPVHAYTNYPKGELFVNGMSQGIAEKNDSSVYTKYRLIWNQVVYEPGELRVVVYDNDGNVAMEQRIKTPSKPQNIVATADRQVIDADGDDLTYITMEIQDAQGNFCPRATNEIVIDVQGVGELLAVDNGDQTSLVPFQRNQIKAFSGKAVAVVRSLRGNAGDIVVKISSEGLDSCEIIIKTKTH